ncbi:hypothetical protein ANN_22703 [Periplaneta americana]|uniref:Reverse transcriptase domain-containing protein n=1 Tax=Periplaneta americana TaxID=6978 RepID=A0ABQ8S968_PERAM|nr:hypothetical protein ANN_22703 [Periplaneta americana]
MMTTLNLKTRTKIGCWNVNTMREPSRLAQIKEMKEYKLDILGLSETRWNGKGEHVTAQGDLLIYSGRNLQEKHERGVGILLSKNTRKSLIEWKPISDRIITARFTTKLRKLTLIQCYAPMEVSAVEDKDVFYEQLSATMMNVKKSDIAIIMGDLNAKVGSSNSNVEHVMGKHGLGVMDDNGERFIEFCSNQNLIIGGTWFPHKNIHKGTWVSPDQRTLNQIDHTAISKKWKSSLQDVRVYRGADVALDHLLVIAQVKLKITTNYVPGTQNSRRKYKTDLLKDKRINQSFEDKLQTLQEEIEENQKPPDSNNWNKVQNFLINACEDILGRNKVERKEWITDDTWNKIKERKDIKNKLNNVNKANSISDLRQQYQAKNKEVKKAARRDKRIWLDTLAENAQKAADTNNSQELYRITKKLAHKSLNQDGHQIKNKDGLILTSEVSQLARWTEYFSETLTDPTESPPNTNVPEEQPNELRINSKEPTIFEIKNAISKLKNGKSAGPDNLLPEIFKAYPNKIAKIILPLIQKAREEESFPTEWKGGLIIKIPKKGDLSNCSNWRRITLLNTINKLIAIIIYQRIHDILDPTIRKEQAGFRSHCACVDQINTLRIIIEQSLEFHSPLYLVFIDFVRVFDTLNHTAIWQTLYERRVPIKLINIIKELYRNASCRVIHKNNIGEVIHVGKAACYHRSSLTWS